MYTYDPVTGTVVKTGPTGVVAASTPLSYNQSTRSISLQQASSTQAGYLSAADWTTFDNKLDASRFNYITNPDAEIDASGWNLYDDSGRTVAAYYLEQDITWTAVATGNAGNGINVRYDFHASQSSSTPLVTVVSPTLITIAWYNGPTLANNPTATQLKAAFDAVPGAVALVTGVITGTASDRQYITGNHVLGNGGDTSPVDGTGGIPTGITFIRSTIPPALIENAEFILSKDATSQMGNGVSTDFTINSADKGNPLQVTFYYSTNSVLGSSSDIRIFIYDVTNAALIPLSRSTLTGPTANLIYRYVGQFTSSSTSVNYRLILHTATSNASTWDTKLDGVTVNSVLDASAATKVPSVVLETQPISGAVNTTNGPMAVAWTDGATQWVPATSAFNGDSLGMFGFATNIIGLTADITIRGYLDGFSFGPFAGYNQYVDPANAGGLTPLPSPFTDTYLIMGKGISATAINVQPFVGQDLITSKGGLLTNAGANNGTGDQVLSVGANGNVVIANSATATGLQWAPAVVAAAPFTYTLATRTLTIATSTNSVAGVLSAADHTTYSGYAATIATKQSTTLTNAHILVGNVSNVATDVAVTGDVSITNAGVTAITAATVTGKLITGFVSGAGTVAATDTILQAFNKINGNVALKAPLASPVFTGDVNASTGNILISTLGKGLQVKTGTNSKIGRAVLVGGVILVTNTSITANSQIFLTSQIDGGTVGSLRVSSRVVGTSFTISSSNVLDTSTVAWMIVESIP